MLTSARSEVLLPAWNSQGMFSAMPLRWYVIVCRPFAPVLTPDTVDRLLLLLYRLRPIVEDPVVRPMHYRSALSRRVLNYARKSAV